MEELVLWFFSLGMGLGCLQKGLRGRWETYSQHLWRDLRVESLGFQCPGRKQRPSTGCMVRRNHIPFWLSLHFRRFVPTLL